MARKSATKRPKNEAKKKKKPNPKKKQSTTPALKFLKSAHSAVRSHLAAASDLPTFLDTAGILSLNGRKRLVEQAWFLSTTISSTFH